LGATVEVLQGIDPTDNIVVNPPDSLEQGEEVRVSSPNVGGVPDAH
jgi:hypothetical protein